MKRLIQQLLGTWGYRLQDMKRFGRDPWRDLEILLQNVPAPVCFDVGAHRGETTRHILRHFPQASIYAFEPDPDNFAALQTATRGMANVKLCQQALGDYQQTAKLQKLHFSMSNSLLPVAATVRSDAHKKVGDVEVRVNTIDEFCEAQKIETIDLLKTDCQGFDLRVLKGATRMLTAGRVQLIQSESLFVAEYEGQGWFHEILNFLTNIGYVPVSFGDPARNQLQEVMWTDVIFKRREPAPA